MFFLAPLRPHFYCPLVFAFFHPKTDQLSLSQPVAAYHIAATDEDVRSIGHGNKTESFAGIEPFHNAPTPAHRQQVATPWTMFRLLRLTPLLPSRPYERDSAMLAGEESIWRQL